MGGMGGRVKRRGGMGGMGWEVVDGKEELEGAGGGMERWEGQW